MKSGFVKNNYPVVDKYQTKYTLRPCVDLATTYLYK